MAAAAVEGSIEFANVSSLNKLDCIFSLTEEQTVALVIFNQLFAIATWAVHATEQRSPSFCVASTSQLKHWQGPVSDATPGRLLPMPNTIYLHALW